MTGIALALALLAAPAPAQDTLRLPALQQAALRQDPRARQAALQAQATELRLRNLRAERLPALTGRAQATHQSEVATIPIALPGGAVPPEPPKDQYEARVEVEQLLYDGGVLSRRRGAEQAQLAVEQARIAADLQPLRDEVNEAFFTAFLLQERAAEISTLLEDLEARLAMLRAQVRNGAALPGDTAVVMATALKAMEDRTEVLAGRRAALGRLSVLTGIQASERDVLALPQLAGAVEGLRGAAGSAGAGAAPIPTARPEYAVFAGRRERLARDAAVMARSSNCARACRSTCSRRAMMRSSVCSAVSSRVMSASSSCTCRCRRAMKAASSLSTIWRCTSSRARSRSLVPQLNGAQRIRTPASQ